MEWFQYQIEKLTATPSSNQAYWEKAVAANKQKSDEQKVKWAAPTQAASFWSKLARPQLDFDASARLRLLPGRQDTINSVVAKLDAERRGL